jgi:hypothetical protein
MEAADLDNSQKAVLLSLANMPEGPSKGKLFFEKLLFLLTKADREELQELDQSFEPYRLGMYSEYADEILQRFDAMGLAEDNVITASGRKLAAEIATDPSSRGLSEGISKVMKFVAGLDTPDLLYAAYRLYPELTAKSEISDRIHSDKLEHFSIAPNTMRDGETTTAVSDKGNKVRVTRRGHRLEIEVP